MGCKGLAAERTDRKAWWGMVRFCCPFLRRENLAGVCRLSSMNWPVARPERSLQGARTRGRGGGRFRRGLAWQGQSLETGPHPGLATVQLPDLLQALTSLSSLQGGS